MKPFDRTYTVDLAKGPIFARETRPLSSGNANADRFSVRVTNGNTDVDLGDSSVTGAVVRADGKTVLIDGNVAGAEAYLILKASCYVIPGPVRVSISLTNGGYMQTLAIIDAYVQRISTDEPADTGDAVCGFAICGETMCGGG